MRKAKVVLCCNDVVSQHWGATIKRLVEMDVRDFEGLVHLDALRMLAREISFLADKCARMEEERNED